MNGRKRLLIVDDSPTWRSYLRYIFEKDGYFDVIGTAVDGLDALEKTRLLVPDVITMDIEMPRMNGIEASRRIMEFHPVPIIIVSDFWETEAVKKAFDAMEIGAVAGVQKPSMIVSERAGAEQISVLVRTVKLMSEVPVIRRSRLKPGSRYEEKDGGTAASFEGVSKVRLVVIGASTGGPVVLKEIFSRLPANFPLPIAVVQHIAPGFITGFVKWLEQASPLRFSEACHGEELLPGTVYLAPDGVHMEVDHRLIVRLTDGPAEHGVKPSVSVLFRSVAKNLGPHAVGVLLTGMGKDGAEELLAMRRAGAITIAQDEDSSLVFGMPGEAVRLSGATMVLPPERIARYLMKLGGEIEREGG
ncbi:chemotaxis-specific protein-glutamate methyltransferase CheB [Thermodesulforhabdus norvegica]|uniref:Protein-glutamate methylesterase/protein-glutamine glutaminase n=1 Tax=Thermodesulforhabdus norvegica TaxID=39841 RepID=A0A1I4UV49_9BACT|nr:chemotaxis-specific protein-glutamate methyltransferase CheB [Thermodesulforhabdus norvegica]SFM92660.1 two-component system, chemotaxis family, response regulator CheB [Thermodesulforhabdus norvegica]